MLYVNKIYIILTHNVTMCVIVFFLHYPDCFSIVPVTCDSSFYSPDGPTVGRLGSLTKWRSAAGDLNNVSLVVVIVHFLNCFNNYSLFRYSYMYIIMFITYICIFSDKLPSHRPMPMAMPYAMASLPYTHIQPYTITIIITISYSYIDPLSALALY